MENLEALEDAPDPLVIMERLRNISLQLCLHSPPSITRPDAPRCHPSLLSLEQRRRTQLRAVVEECIGPLEELQPTCSASSKGSTVRPVRRPQPTRSVTEGSKKSPSTSDFPSVIAVMRDKWGVKEEPTGSKQLLEKVVPPPTVLNNSACPPVSMNNVLRSGQPDCNPNRSDEQMSSRSTSTKSKVLLHQQYRKNIATSHKSIAQRSHHSSRSKVVTMHYHEKILNVSKSLGHSNPPDVEQLQVSEGHVPRALSQQKEAEAEEATRAADIAIRQMQQALQEERGLRLQSEFESKQNVDRLKHRLRLAEITAKNNKCGNTPLPPTRNFAAQTLSALHNEWAVAVAVVDPSVEEVVMPCSKSSSEVEAVDHAKESFIASSEWVDKYLR